MKKPVRSIGGPAPTAAKVPPSSTAELEVALDPVALAGGHDGSADGAGVGRVAGAQAAAWSPAVASTASS